MDSCKRSCCISGELSLILSIVAGFAAGALFFAFTLIPQIIFLVALIVSAVVWLLILLTRRSESNIQCGCACKNIRCKLMVTDLILLVLSAVSLSITTAPVLLTGILFGLVVGLLCYLLILTFIWTVCRSTDIRV